MSRDVGESGCSSGATSAPPPSPPSASAVVRVMASTTLEPGPNMAAADAAARADVGERPASAGAPAAGDTGCDKPVSTSTSWSMLLALALTGLRGATGTAGAACAPRSGDPSCLLGLRGGATGRQAPSGRVGLRGGDPTGGAASVPTTATGRVAVGEPLSLASPSPGQAVAPTELSLPGPAPPAICCISSTSAWPGADTVRAMSPSACCASRRARALSGERKPSVPSEPSRLSPSSASAPPSPPPSPPPTESDVRE
eukprot:47026-Chlamydomonas_euryale.AAC.1